MTTQCRLLHNWASWAILQPEQALPPELQNGIMPALQGRRCLRCDLRQLKPVMATKAFAKLMPKLVVVPHD